MQNTSNKSTTLAQEVQELLNAEGYGFAFFPAAFEVYRDITAGAFDQARQIVEKFIADESAQGSDFTNYVV